MHFSTEKTGSVHNFAQFCTNVCFWRAIKHVFPKAYRVGFFLTTFLIFGSFWVKKGQKQLFFGVEKHPVFSCLQKFSFFCEKGVARWKLQPNRENKSFGADLAGAIFRVLTKTGFFGCFLGVFGVFLTVWESA